MFSLLSLGELLYLGELLGGADLATVMAIATQQSNTMGVDLYA
jgi:hypothetical protein